MHNCTPTYRIAEIHALNIASRSTIKPPIATKLMPTSVALFGFFETQLTKSTTGDKFEVLLANCIFSPQEYNTNQAFDLNILVFSKFIYK
jgi:hypothetical protein